MSTAEQSVEEAIRNAIAVEQRWRCQWCGHASPVPSLNEAHEATCVARPAKDTP